MKESKELNYLVKEKITVKHFNFHHNKLKTNVFKLV